ncbi:MAG: TraR/DksA C4-type zinc finger protein [Clostridiales bacterium]|jgi:YteA family regulatory protein|nr:TraR/DksA C4-type zinc finger protein [Eubacteriales bacterium]MDH7565203.1 TraR/DksA C4-type zinc finger protein [Clostridiales bacterium]
MDRNNINHFRDLLNRQEKEIERTIQRMKENNTGEQNNTSPNELSNYDNHPAEMGTEVFMITMNNALKVHEEHLLKEIRDALGRIEDGTYGKCAFCGEDIDVERLEALPYTRLCIGCENSKAVDPEILRKQRPNEELVLDAPFGRKYLNEREDDEYEGMDFLNDVMKYGSADSPQDLGGYHHYEEYYTNEIDKQGVVDNMDQVSNQEYKKQLPD